MHSQSKTGSAILFCPCLSKCVKVTSGMTIIETDGIDKEYFNKRNRLAGFSFKCWTAWREPLPVWQKLTEMDICVTAYYADEGGYFCGIYEDGEVSESTDFDSELGKIVIKNCGLELQAA